jgi:6-phosphogluconolactonase
MAGVNLRKNEKLIIGRDLDEAVTRAAERVTAVLAGKGSRSVALSGGRTPAALYAQLAGAFRDRVDWSGVEWFWGDERTVPPDHADSNYRMARESLLEPLRIASERVHRMPADATDLDAAAREYEQAIRQHVPAGADGVPQFDLILLGMGADGHTASLFPGSSGLGESQRLVVAHHVPSQNTWRMTLTYPVLLAARHIVFLVTGADKTEMLRTVLTSPLDAGPPSVRVREATGEITWIVDAAAGRLVGGE